MTSYASARGKIMFVPETIKKQMKRLTRRISNDNHGNKKTAL